jgi:hypothetical protein
MYEFSWLEQCASQTDLRKAAFCDPVSYSEIALVIALAVLHVARRVSPHWKKSKLKGSGHASSARINTDLLSVSLQKINEPIRDL